MSHPPVTPQLNTKAQWQEVHAFNDNEGTTKEQVMQVLKLGLHELESQENDEPKDLDEVIEEIDTVVETEVSEVL